MQEIGCSVAECAYNSAGVCDAQEILVCGHNATNPDATCCGTFRKGDEQMTNSIPSGGTYIGCEVTNCAYNTDNECDLDRIQVDKFAGICANEDETFCGSFDQES